LESWRNTAEEWTSSVEFLPTLVVVASPFVGSFIGCVADRLPADRPLLWSRSSCDHCDHALGPRDLVPVFSWILSGAKCRYCGGRLSPYYPLVEAVALGVALWALLVFDGRLLWITVGLGWGLLALAAMDVRHMILADSLNAILAVSGLLVALWWSHYSMQSHVVGLLVGAGGLYLVNMIYRSVRGRDGLGLGDVKLMAGAGAWLGWQGLPSVLLYACTAALLVVFSGLLVRNPKRDTAIPFGAFICLGIWLTWIVGPIGLIG
jgi:leader peptidase (prepilin peptidase)/N-methyltransferase